MSKTSGFKHSLYADFLLLYKCIYYGYSIEKTCNLLGKHRSTVFRIIHNYGNTLKGAPIHQNGKHRYCIHLKDCVRKESFQFCPKNCPNYKKYQCPTLLKWPYVCNRCEKFKICKKPKRFFDPEFALGVIRSNEKESKHIPKIGKKKLENFDNFVSPLIKAGVSIEAIYDSYPKEFPCSTRTVRNWINHGYLTAKRIDLINAMARPYISKAYKYAPVTTRNPLMKASRTFEDYLKFIKDHPGFNIVQLDTVHGKRGDKKCILTIYDVITRLQLGLLLESFTANEVKEKVANIRSLIGEKAYFELFKVMLADNGPEFDELYKLEIDDETGEKWSSVFFTRPYRSGDKGACERNHEFFRYIMAKGKSFNDLSQDDLDYYFSMINSYPRRSLNGSSPIETLDKKYGENFHQKHNLTFIELKDINFKIKKKS